MIRSLRIMAASFMAQFAKQILPRRAPQTDGSGAWGDLIDPPVPCGECEIEDDQCACLSKLYAKHVNIEGYSVDQLYRDIEALENQDHG